MYKRFQKLEEVQTDSIFLFGARQTGKTTLINELFPKAKHYDLLDSSTLSRLTLHPELLRQEVLMLPKDSLVVIDEIPLLPALLNEVHWLIVHHSTRFVLTGSSARKLRRGGNNTLGGRANPNVLHPLVSYEVDDFDLIKAVNQGMLPRHYMADPATSWRRRQAYIGVYLKEEIIAEAVVRNLAAFNRFLEVAAMTDGEMVNMTNIAQDCGVDQKTIKEYFQILDDTLIGRMVPAFTKVVKRRVRQAPRFYMFDIGIVNFLLGRRKIEPGSADFGHALEHFLIQEIIAWLDYNNIDGGLSYWHTYNDYEVDAILGNAKVAIEFKSCTEVQPRHLKGLKAFSEEHPDARKIIVSLDASPRLLNGVEVLPATEFLKRLWNNEIVEATELFL